MNPCHPLCFFSYFLHEESICFVEAQEVLPEYLLPLALALTTIVVKQDTIVYLNISNLVHVSTLSPTSPTPMHSVQPTAYFYSNSRNYKL